MSNVIPILSSSPPPIDDSAPFEDDWGSDDFGGFQAAGTPGGETNNFASFPPPVQPARKAEQHFKPISKPSNGTEQLAEENWADFARGPPPPQPSPPPPPPPPVVDGEFVAFPTDSDSKTGPSIAVNKSKDLTNDGDPSVPSGEHGSEFGLPLRSSIDRTAAHGEGRKTPRSSSSSTGSQEERQTSSCGDEFSGRPSESKAPKPDTQDNTSQDSVTDSGLCSDISPVPKFEEYPDFGDNKSSEVEFSDEAQSKGVGPPVEQDEGFANFSTNDSCGSCGEKQARSSSRRRDSGDCKLSAQADHLQREPDPLDLRPASSPVGEADLADDFGQFSCSSGEGMFASTDLDPDTVTPTQSQYDTDNIPSDSSSPNPKISPDQETSCETPANDFSSDAVRPSPPANNQTDTSGSCNVLEALGSKGHLSESADDFSDFQSHPPSFQDSEAESAVSTTSRCDSSGTQPAAAAIANDPLISALPPVRGEETSSSPRAEPAARSAASSRGSTIGPRETDEATAEDEEEEEDSADWDLKDAAQTSAPTARNPDKPELSAEATEEKDAREKDGNDADDDDDDDDFGDFSTLPPDPSIKRTTERKDETRENDDDDDDDDEWAFQESTAAPTKVADGGFGDFSSSGAQAGFAAFTETTTTTSSGQEDNNWASFAEPAHSVAPAAEVPSKHRVDDGNDEDDDNFGDFDEAPSTGVGSMGALPQVTTSPAISAVEKEPVHTVIERSFDQPSLAEDFPKTDLLFVHMTRQIIRKEEVPLKQPGRHSSVKSAGQDMSVWNNLRDLEKTAALRYSWDKSSNNQCLLHALSIDTRNILIGHKKPSVPIFASNLGSGVLEPSREPPAVGRDGRVSDRNAIIHTINTGSKLTAGTPQDIPPAEFDWSSAGLTNPLDSSNIQLDLDFFVKKTAWAGHSAYTATSPTAALEKELLGSIEPNESRQPKTLEPLENYLANLNVAPTAPAALTQETDGDALTEPAFEVVTHLPDLSFMHAKMLMFPLKGSAD